MTGCAVDTQYGPFSRPLSTVSYTIHSSLRRLTHYLLRLSSCGRQTEEDELYIKHILYS